MGLVLDTNVVASALLWNGPPRRLLQAAQEGVVQIYSSPPLLAELRDVLSRPKFKKRIEDARLSVERLIDIYSELVCIVQPVHVDRLAPDPDDDVVIGTALAAKAGFIVTGDHGLLSVMSYEGGRIKSVAEILKALALSAEQNEP